MDSQEREKFARERRDKEEEEDEEKGRCFFMVHMKDSVKHRQSNNVIQKKKQISPTESSHEQTHEGHPW